MPRRIGIFGASEQALRLVRLLSPNPRLEISAIWDTDPDAALQRARNQAPQTASVVERLLTNDLDAFVGNGRLDAVVEGGVSPSFADRFPRAAEHGVQILSPLVARLLWAYESGARDPKADLLTTLREVVQSVDFVLDSSELLSRMLEIAVGVTDADGGSLMLLDERSQELRIHAAIGVERELWPKIRMAIGEGIAGRVAKEVRPLLVTGQADPGEFEIVRERLDVESAMSLPLTSAGRVIGVLNLHRRTLRDAFGRDDLDFMEQVAQLDARILTQAKKHETLRDQAALDATLRSVAEILTGPSPLHDRLTKLCTFLSEKFGGGIATLYLVSTDGTGLRLAATSLDRASLGGEHRIAEGQGIDGGVAQSHQPAFLRANDGGIAYASLPLTAGERLIGVLSIQSGARTPQGCAAEDPLLAMANAIAQGVARAEHAARLEMRAERVSALNEAALRMMSCKELNQVTQLATTAISSILATDHAVLRLQDGQTKRYVVRSHVGDAEGHAQERLFALDRRACVEAIRLHRTVRATDLAQHEDFAAFRDEFRSFLCAPLVQQGRVMGTLSVYDKIATDGFCATAFEEDDLEVFTRFLASVERAIEGARSHSPSSQHENFDEQTGLPNARFLGKRIHEEVARSNGREDALAIVLCKIENLAQISERMNPAHAYRCVQRTADALRAHLRDFDVVGRSATSEFTIVLPDPGASPSERVFELARTVAEEISKDPTLNDPVRVALAFGYAIPPADGRDRSALLARASETRIRMG